MGFWLLGPLAILAFVLNDNGAIANRQNDMSFDENYVITWGYDHVMSLNQGREIQLSMDNTSGAGFGSKMNYSSGFFNMRIMLPDKDSAGVVTTFYLHSHTDKHDELDFEFLGNREGKPYILQTNVFTNGQGDREQRIHLWFDPTLDFHTYKILWNPYQIVFFVDEVPIRVFKNKTSIGIGYPSQSMRIEGSLWDGEDWATDGGKTKTNWSYAPFKAHFQGFNIDGCPSSNPQPCYSSKFWWNGENYKNLNPTQQRQYEAVRMKFMIYDYCSDRSRYPTPPPECERSPSS